MTVIEAFESLLSTFLGNTDAALTSYLATVFSVLVFCGMLALCVGIFNRRAGRYIGIVAIIVTIAVSLCYATAFRINVLPEGAVINLWY